MRYLIDIYTKADQRIVNKLVAPPQDMNNEDEVGRYMWQISNADNDVLMSDLEGMAVYHPDLENTEKYKDTNGVAVLMGSGEELVGKVSHFLNKAKERKASFAGWDIKEFIVPSLYKAFIVNDFTTNVLDIFDRYPFDNKKTLDLKHLYNFNGQQRTVRGRNIYSLEEVAFAFGGGGDYELSLAYKENDVHRILLERIRMAKFLYNRRGLEW